MKLIRVAICFLTMLILTNSQAQKLNLLIGTYTKSGKSEGIYVYSFDTVSGKVSYKNKASGLNNPSYLAISKDNKYVYAVSEAGPGKGGLSSFSFDMENGSLTPLNTHSSGGDGPCYVAVDDKNQHAFVANYVGGSFSAIPLNPKTGAFEEPMQTFKFSGNSINKDRQKSPHVHSTVLSKDNAFLFVSDLGTDRINGYRYNPSNKKAPLSSTKQGFISVKAGSGPRHFDFHPDGKFAYSIQEMSGIISAFKLKKGSLELIEDISGTPSDFNGKVWAADIHISGDGKFLYASYRDDLNCINIYKIDKATGKLSFVASQSTLGSAPRNFVIDPTGNFLLAANQNSDTVVIFRRDTFTGHLSDTGERIEVGSPVCLKFPH